MAPKGVHDASVEDVEWGDDASGGDEETESEKSAHSADVVPKGDDDAGDVAFKPAGHSSIGVSDIGGAHLLPPVAKKGEKKASFEDWMSKGEGEDFGEDASDDGKDAAAKAAPDEGTAEKKEEAKAKEGPADASEKDPAEKEPAKKDPADAAEKKEGQETAAADKDAENTEPPPLPPPPSGEEGQADVTLDIVPGDDDDALCDTPPAEEEDEADPDAKKVAIAEEGEEGGELDTLGIGLGEGAALEVTPTEDEDDSQLNRRQKVWREFIRRKTRAGLVFARVRDRHTRKVRCVLCPVFVCMSPIFLLWILYKAFRYLVYQLFRNQQKEEEEEERKAQEEEAKRIAAAIAAGPQRSRLKPPAMTGKFGRNRQLQNAAGKHDDDEGGRGDHKMTLREAAKGLGKESVHDKAFAEAKKITMEGFGGKHHAYNDPLWRRMLPTRWPKYVREWWKSRNAYLKKVSAVIDTIEEEEEFDWENLDENGNPATNKFLVPRRVRRKYRFFILVYWDPLIDLLDNWPLFVRALRWFIRFLPLFAMLGSFAWFGYNLWRNLQYVEGNCIVEKLPLKFETIGLIDEMVRSRYIVRRFFVASPPRPAGYVIQECVANVPCSKMDQGETNEYSDDRCVVFQAWKLGDQITCYYMGDDFWGDDGTQLSCLSLPSKMERESFTVAIAVCVNVLICVILGVYKYHKGDLKRQADLATAEQEAAVAQEAAAKKLIEEMEANDALKQQEAVNKELGIDEDGDDEAMGDMAAFMAAKDDESQDQDR